MFHRFEQQEMASETPEVQTAPIDLNSDPNIAAELNYVAIEADEDEIMEDTEEPVKTLPLSKVKRIFKLDPEYSGAAASAAYATAIATELFVQYLAEQSAMIAKTERRKKIQYKDVSAAANSQEALYFLSDTIPKTQILSEAIKQKKVNISVEDQHKLKSTTQEGEDVSGNVESAMETNEIAIANVSELPKGQSTLPFEVVADTRIKKAGLLDLILNDEPMIID